MTRAAYTAPPLITVRRPFDTVPQKGLKRLVRAIENPQAEAVATSDPPVDVVARASTRPPPQWRNIQRLAPTEGRVHSPRDDADQLGP